MKFKSYPKYKNSRIQWLGGITEGWEIKKLKFIVKQKKFSVVDGPFGSQMKIEDFVDKGVPVIEMEHIKDDIFKDTIDRFITEEKFKKLLRSCAKSGDIIFSKTGTIGLVANLPSYLKKSIITSRLAKISLNNGIISSGFAVFYLINLRHNGYWKFTSYGSTMDILTIFMISNTYFLIPSRKEQNTISNFLDKKTSQIDELIKKDKKLIELLKEKRTALINHAVTKGLDPNANMKDSGIDWIGEIPEGWEVKKLKFSVYEKKIKDTTKNPNTKFIGLEHIESETGKLISSSTLEDIDGESVRFKENNVLFGKLRPYLAKVIKVDFRGSCTGELIVYEARGKIDSKFLFYRLLSKGFIDLVNSTTYGVKMPRADPTQLSNIKIAWPPLPEQTTIVNFLGKATVKMDKTIQKIEQKIKFLEEYKKSLIHRTVTGKIDVREVKI